MKVLFNTSMSYNVTLADLNKTTVDMYIDPATDHYYSAEHRLRSNINFTWSLVKFANQRMHFKLVFENPLAISRLGQYDDLVLHIKNLTKPWFC